MPEGLGNFQGAPRQIVVRLSLADAFSQPLENLAKNTEKTLQRLRSSLNTAASTGGGNFSAQFSLPAGTLEQYERGVKSAQSLAAGLQNARVAQEAWAASAQKTQGVALAQEQSIARLTQQWLAYAAAIRDATAAAAAFNATAGKGGVPPPVAPSGGGNSPVAPVVGGGVGFAQSPFSSSSAALLPQSSYPRGSSSRTTPPSQTVNFVQERNDRVRFYKQIESIVSNRQQGTAIVPSPLHGTRFSRAAQPLYSVGNLTPPAYPSPRTPSARPTPLLPAASPGLYHTPTGQRAEILQNARGRDYARLDTPQSRRQVRRADVGFLGTNLPGSSSRTARRAGAEAAVDLTRPRTYSAPLPIRARVRPSPVLTGEVESRAASPRRQRLEGVSEQRFTGQGYIPPPTSVAGNRRERLQNRDFASLEDRTRLAQIGTTAGGSNVEIVRSFEQWQTQVENTFDRLNANYSTNNPIPREQLVSLNNLLSNPPVLRDGANVQNRFAQDYRILSQRPDLIPEAVQQSRTNLQKSAFLNTSDYLSETLRRYKIPVTEYIRDESGENVIGRNPRITPAIVSGLASLEIEKIAAADARLLPAAQQVDTQSSLSPERRRILASVLASSGIVFGNDVRKGIGTGKEGSVPLPITPNEFANQRLGLRLQAAESPTKAGRERALAAVEQLDRQRPESLSNFLPRNLISEQREPRQQSTLDERIANTEDKVKKYEERQTRQQRGRDLFAARLTSAGISDLSGNAQIEKFDQQIERSRQLAVKNRQALAKLYQQKDVNDGKIITKEQANLRDAQRTVARIEGSAEFTRQSVGAQLAETQRIQEITAPLQQVASGQYNREALREAINRNPLKSISDLFFGGGQIEIPANARYGSEIKDVFPTNKIIQKLEGREISETLSGRPGYISRFAQSQIDALQLPEGGGQAVIDKIPAGRLENDFPLLLRHRQAQQRVRTLRREQGLNSEDFARIDSERQAYQQSFKAGQANRTSIPLTELSPIRISTITDRPPKQEFALEGRGAGSDTPQPRVRELLGKFYAGVTEAYSTAAQLRTQEGSFVQRAVNEALALDVVGQTLDIYGKAATNPLQNEQLTSAIKQAEIAAADVVYAERALDTYSTEYGRLASASEKISSVASSGGRLTSRQRRRLERQQKAEGGTETSLAERAQRQTRDIVAGDPSAQFSIATSPQRVQLAPTLSDSEFQELQRSSFGRKLSASEQGLLPAQPNIGRLLPAPPGFERAEAISDEEFNRLREETRRGRTPSLGSGRTGYEADLSRRRTYDAPDFTGKIFSGFNIYNDNPVFRSRANARLYEQALGTGRSLGAISQSDVRPVIDPETGFGSQPLTNAQKALAARSTYPQTARAQRYDAQASQAFRGLLLSDSTGIVPAASRTFGYGQGSQPIESVRVPLSSRGTAITPSARNFGYAGGAAPIESVRVPRGGLTIGQARPQEAEYVRQSASGRIGGTDLARSSGFSYGDGTRRESVFRTAPFRGFDPGSPAFLKNLNILDSKGSPVNVDSFSNNARNVFSTGSGRERAEFIRNLGKNFTFSTGGGERVSAARVGVHFAEETAYRAANRSAAEQQQRASARTTGQATRRADFTPGSGTPGRERVDASFRSRFTHGFRAYREDRARAQAERSQQRQAESQARQRARETSRRTNPYRRSSAVGQSPILTPDGRVLGSDSGGRTGAYGVSGGLYGLGVLTSALGGGPISGLVGGGIQAAATVSNPYLFAYAVAQSAQSFTQIASESNRLRGIDLAYGNITTNVLGQGGGDALLGQLQNNFGTISTDSELKEFTNRILSIDAATTVGETVDLAEIGLGLGKAFGRTPEESIQSFSLLLSNESIRRLDSFGISAIQVRRRMAELADEQDGLTRSERFYIATTEAAETSLEKIGGLRGITTESEAFSTRVSRGSEELIKDIGGAFFEPAAEFINRIAEPDEARARDVAQRIGKNSLSQQIIEDSKREVQSDFVSVLGRDFEPFEALKAVAPLDIARLGLRDSAEGDKRQSQEIIEGYFPKLLPSDFIAITDPLDIPIDYDFLNNLGNEQPFSLGHAIAGAPTNIFQRGQPYVGYRTDFSNRYDEGRRQLLDSAGSGDLFSFFAQTNNLLEALRFTDTSQHASLPGRFRVRPIAQLEDGTIGAKARDILETQRDYPIQIEEQPQLTGLLSKFTAAFTLQEQGLEKRNVAGALNLLASGEDLSPGFNLDAFNLGSLGGLVNKINETGGYSEGDINALNSIIASSATLEERIRNIQRSTQIADARGLGSSGFTPEAFEHLLSFTSQAGERAEETAAQIRDGAGGVNFNTGAIFDVFSRLPGGVVNNAGERFKEEGVDLLQYVPVTGEQYIPEGPIQRKRPSSQPLVDTTVRPDFEDSAKAYGLETSFAVRPLESADGSPTQKALSGSALELAAAYGYELPTSLALPKELEDLPKFIGEQAALISQYGSDAELFKFFESNFGDQGKYRSVLFSGPEEENPFNTFDLFRNFERDRDAFGLDPTTALGVQAAARYRFAQSTQQAIQQQVPQHPLQLLGSQIQDEELASFAQRTGLPVDYADVFSNTDRGRPARYIQTEKEIATTAQFDPVAAALATETLSSAFSEARNSISGLTRYSGNQKLDRAFNEVQDIIDESGNNLLQGFAGSELVQSVAGGERFSPLGKLTGIDFRTGLQERPFIPAKYSTSRVFSDDQIQGLLPTASAYVSTVAHRDRERIAIPLEHAQRDQAQADYIAAGGRVTQSKIVSDKAYDRAEQRRSGYAEEAPQLIASELRRGAGDMADSVDRFISTVDQESASSGFVPTGNPLVDSFLSQRSSSNAVQGLQDDLQSRTVTRLVSPSRYGNVPFDPNDPGGRRVFDNVSTEEIAGRATYFAKAAEEFGKASESLGGQDTEAGRQASGIAQEALGLSETYQETAQIKATYDAGQASFSELYGLNQGSSAETQFARALENSGFTPEQIQDALETNAKTFGRETEASEFATDPGSVAGLYRQRLLTEDPSTRAAASFDAQYTHLTNVRQTNLGRNLTPDESADVVRRIALEQGLLVSGSGTLATHSVQEGDTLSGIAAQNGIPLELLRSLNPNVDPRSLGIGSNINVGGEGVSFGTISDDPADFRLRNEFAQREGLDFNADLAVPDDSPGLGAFNDAIDSLIEIQEKSAEINESEINPDVDIEIKNKDDFDDLFEKWQSFYGSDNEVRKRIVLEVEERSAGGRSNFAGTATATPGIS